MATRAFVPDSVECRRVTAGFSAGAPSRVARRWTIRLAAFLLLVLFLGAIPAGVPDSVDAGSKLLQSRALVGHASLSIPPEIRGESVDHLFRGPDGLWYSIHSIGLPLIWTVPVALADAGSKLVGMPASVLTGFSVCFVNPLVITATMASLVTILRRLGESHRSQIVTVAVFALGAQTLPYANSCWSEPLVGLLVLWSVALPLMQPDSYRTAFISGLLVSAAMLVRPETVLLTGPLLLMYREHWRRGVALCAGAGLGPLITLLLNALTTGSIFVFGHGEEVKAFGDPRPGFYGLTLDLNHSIFVYCPALVLGTYCWLRMPALGALRRGRICVPLAVGLYFVFYSAWHGWWGGYCFGPRYLYWLAAIVALPVGPALCAWANRYPHRSTATAVWAVVALALLCELPVQLSGMCVKDHQAIAVSNITHESQWLCQMKLLSLKLRRGMDTTEQYLKSDFVALAPGEEDVEIDHRQFRTYQYLNHWWSILLANRARHSPIIIVRP